jgi:hypothetical protein
LPDLKTDVPKAPMKSPRRANLEFSKHKKPHFIGTSPRREKFAPNSPNNKSLRVVR